MKTDFVTENPDSIEMTMTITMSLGKWRELRKAIKEQYPGWEFANAISEMVHQATKHFSAEEVE
jgi:hypothetical protein